MLVNPIRMIPSFLGCWAARCAALHPDLPLLAEAGRAVVRELTSKWLRRGTHRPVAELERAIPAWIDTWNQHPRPVVGTRTADEILDPIATYCQRINNSVAGSW
jgi:hypothetical protein